MRQAQVFVYANGNDHPPTAIDLNKSSLKELLFNQSPAKVCVNVCLFEAVSITGNLFLVWSYFDQTNASIDSFQHFSCVVEGCCLSFSFHEAYSICSSVGETLTHRRELWLSKEILHRNYGGQCHTHFSPAEHVQLQPPGEGF